MTDQLDPTFSLSEAERAHARERATAIQEINEGLDRVQAIADRLERLLGEMLTCEP